MLIASFNRPLIKNKSPVNFWALAGVLFLILFSWLNNPPNPTVFAIPNPIPPNVNPDSIVVDDEGWDGFCPAVYAEGGGIGGESIADAGNWGDGWIIAGLDDDGIGDTGETWFVMGENMDEFGVTGDIMRDFPWIAWAYFIYLF